MKLKTLQQRESIALQEAPQLGGEKIKKNAIAGKL